MSAQSTLSQTPAQATPRAGRFGGLDGLRAIAVGMVLVYHLFPKALPGGFLGVDVFFVISGFLITSLLLRERTKTGRIDLLAFWRRRARRLLPAVALVVIVSSALALAASRDLLVGIAKQIAGAVFFVSNWVFIADGSDYFARDAPELFRNFWSLALEEQFYVVLPLLGVLIFRLRSRATRVVPLAALGLGSALLMAWLAETGTEPTRIYFGSDSHSFGLLLGAAMAVLLERGAVAAIGRRGQIASISVAVLSLGVLGVLAMVLPEASQASFQGGFQLATIAALALVWAVTREGAWAGRVLDVAPLRWIGERSYGIYLWHWPLLLIATNIAGRFGPGPAVTVGAPLIALALTLALAALSYTYIEQPVRRYGLRGAFVLWFTPRSYTPRRRAISVTLAAVLAVAFPLTGIAVAIAPAQTTSADTIMRGKNLLDSDRAKPGNTGDDSAGGAVEDEAQDADTKGADSKSADGKGADSKSSDGKGADAKGADSKGGDGKSGGAKKGTPAPEPVRIEGRDITAVGDSVMLASYPELSAAFPSIEVDAAVSRGMWAGVDIVSEMHGAGKLRGVLLIGLATNGPVDTESLDELLRLAGTRPVVLVDAHGERDWIPPVNAELEAFAASHRGVSLARWDSAITPHPDFLAGDGIHPDSDGGEIYAAAVQAALDELGKPGESIGFGVPRR